MSTQARKNKNVDLMRDDPDRLLDVTEASALLSVKSKTLYAWVSRNKIPYRKICSLVRFHRGDLIEWAKGQPQNTSKPTPNTLSVVKSCRFFRTAAERSGENENSDLEAGRKR